MFSLSEPQTYDCSLGYYFLDRHPLIEMDSLSLKYKFMVVSMRTSAAHLSYTGY